MTLDVLLSYAYHRKTDIRALRSALGPDAWIMLDSGAFTAFTTGKPVVLRDYAAWLTEHDGAYNAAVTLDVLGDPITTATNTAWLHSHGYPVLTVATAGTPPAQVAKLAAAAPLFAVGGLVKTPRAILRAYVAACAAIAKRHGSGVHALGVGGPTLLRETGAWSGDSSAPTRSPTFGAVTIWTGRNKMPLGHFAYCVPNTLIKCAF